MKYDVFLSRKSEDAHMAKEIYDFLTAKGLKVFDSDISLQKAGVSEYAKSINHALEVAQHMILVSSSIDNIDSSYVESEWLLFVNEKRSGNKFGNIISVVAESVDPKALPLALRVFECIKFNQQNFEKIYSYVEKRFIDIDLTDSKKNIELIKKQAISEYKNGDFGEARKLFFKLAEADDSESFYYLGEIYENGLGVKIDLDDARFWYLKSAENGNILSLKKIANIYKNENNPSKYLEFVEKLAKIGDAEYQYILGQLYEKQSITNQDKEKVFDCYLKSANQFYAKAYEKVAIFYENGTGVKKNMAEAHEWYKKGADANLPFCQLNIGHYHFDRSEYLKAYEYYEKSANSGNGLAATKNGEILERGLGFVVDYDLAIHWYRLAIKNNTDNETKAATFNNLGVIYFFKNEPIEAFKNIKQGYELDPKAMHTLSLGYCYTNGQGVKKDWKKARELFEEANAKDDLAECHGWLGSINFYEEKFDDSFFHFKKAVDKGVNSFISGSESYATSCFYLGKLYREGKGTEKNTEKAKEFFSEGMKYGSAEATKELAKIEKIEKIEKNAKATFAQKESEGSMFWAGRIFFVLLFFSFIFKIVQCSNGSNDKKQPTLKPFLNNQLDSSIIQLDKNRRINDSIYQSFLDSLKKRDEKTTSSSGAKKAIKKQIVSYRVQDGENWDEISKKFNNLPSELSRINSQMAVGLVRDTIVKVYVQAIHTIGPGDILRVVAKKYSITVAELMKANNKTINYGGRGEKLLIPLKK